MNDTSKVTDAGQVTIPKHIRDKLKIKTRTEMKITTIGDSVIFQKDINEDAISYSFLYNQITTLQNELNRQKELYDTQQRSIINVTMLVDDLQQQLKLLEKVLSKTKEKAKKK